METMDDVYKPNTLAKGRQLKDHPHAVQRDAEDASIWWVKGSTGSKYRVQVIDPGDEDEMSRRVLVEQQRDALSGNTYRTEEQVRRDLEGLPLVSCTCPNGQNRGGRPNCYHSAAVLLILEDGTQLDHPVMENTDPIDEDFVDDETAQALKSQGFTDAEIEFLRN